MPALTNTPTESIACLENGDFGTMLQEDIGTSQASKTSSNYPNTDLFRLRHSTLEHALGIDVLIRVYFSCVQVL